jgi:hypothetical protein
MKQDDVDSMLGNIDLPQTEKLQHPRELKIPLLSYKRSSKAGLWLLAVPVFVALTDVLIYELDIFTPVLIHVHRFFAAVDSNGFFTFFIPILFIGFPVYAMIINLLSFCHFTLVKGDKELIITVKNRPLNIGIFLFSFFILLFFLLPDKLSF